MSQQYSAPPPYGGQYPGTAYYPSYKPIEHVRSASPSMAQQGIHYSHPPTTAQNMNAQRYDANAQVSTPPLPFQFTPNFTPEMFKQIASSHLPLPPPPPPNFTPIPLPNMKYAPVSHQLSMTSPSVQHENDHQQRNRAASSSRDNVFAGYSLPQGNNQDTTAQIHAQRSLHNVPEPMQLVSQPETLPSNGHTYGLDGSGFSSMFRGTTQSIIPGIDHSPEADMSKGMQTSPNHAEMRERAKAAVLALASAGIDYQDLVDEGVDSLVLERLYQDLSLQISKKRKRTEDNLQEKQQEVNREATTQTASALEIISKVGDTDQAPSQGMERKDRIARLLAAKRGQAGAGGKSSQSASPVPEQSTPVPPAAKQSYSAKSHDLSSSERQHAFGNHVKVTPFDSMLMKNAIPRSPRSSRNSSQVRFGQPSSLSAIPGLSMTSADEPDEQTDLQPTFIAKSPSQSGQEDFNTSKEEYDPMQPLLPLSKQDLRSNHSQKLFRADSFDPKLHHSLDIEMQLSQSNAETTNDNHDNDSVDMEDGEYEPTLDAPTAENEITPSSSAKAVQLSAYHLESQSGVDKTVDKFNSSTGSSNANVGRTRGAMPAPSIEVQNSNVKAFSIATPTASLPFQRPTPETPPITSTAQANHSPSTTPGDSLDKRAARMAALKAQLLQKASRKRTVQDGIHAVDVELQSSRLRLAEARQSLVTIQSDIEVKTAELGQVEESRRDLLLQIKALEEQLEAGEIRQKYFTREKSQSSDPTTTQSKIPGDRMYLEQISMQGNAPESSSDDAINEPINNISQEQLQTEPESTVDVAKESVSVAENDLDVASLQHEQSDRQTNSQETSASPRKKPNLSPSISDERSYNNSPTDPNHDQHSDDDQMSMDEGEDSDGSVSMSDSGSDDYEPAEPEKSAETDTESDDYEPQDVELEEPNVNVDSRMADVEELEELDKTTRFHKDTMHSVDVAEDLSNQIPQEATGVLNNGSPATSTTQHSNVSALALPISTVDNQPQLLETTPLISAQDNTQGFELHPDSTITLGFENDSSSPRFMPYQSPLTALKSFRFHPQFNELVKNGYRSLTYSNQIDPKRPFCPTELSGQVCTDSSCEEQHFGSMALSDEMILIQMSSANDLKDKSQRDEYLIGLKKVIADMRERGVKEFAEVAEALSKYRREWTDSRSASIS